MDDIVKQALAKWPHVPACYHWLGLDVRGQWYMRDEATQARGVFPQVKGQRLEHEKLLAFIARNYEVDAQGGWFFQNGPQRVYVELEAAPWVLRLSDSGQLSTHTGHASEALPGGCWVDEVGRAYFSTRHGLGVVHSQDMVLLADALEQGRWPLQSSTHAQLVQRHGILLSPAAAQRLI